MNVFYRYIRPQRLNKKRMELQTLPHGGICLRFERLPEGDLFFTYARCHPYDSFSKDVARVIADDRAAAAKSDARVLQQLRALPDTQSTGQLIHSVIRRCRLMDTPNEHDIVQRYMQQEYSGFAAVLERLEEDNRLEELRCTAWKKGMADVGWAIYQGLNK
jgi:hypothetical protein